MKITRNNISMIRGDSETITVSCKDSNKADIPLVTGDTVYFTIKNTVNDIEKILQKVITEFVNGTAIIPISPEDTKTLDFSTYVYDIQLKFADGTIKTIITPSEFTIEGEVTYE